MKDRAAVISYDHEGEWKRFGCWVAESIAWRKKRCWVVFFALTMEVAGFMWFGEIRGKRWRGMKWHVSFER